MDTSLSFLRLRDLTLLEHVQRLGTLRAVSEALHVTQPAVTQMLKGLEDAFGVGLVERGRRGVQLNAAGRVALSRLECAAREAQLAREEAQSAAQPILRIGSTPMASLQTLPLLVKQMRRVMPQASLILSESGGDALWEQLIRGELDVVVSRLPSNASLTGTQHQVLGSERLVIVSSNQHALAQAHRLRRTASWLQALQKQAWVLPPQETLSMLDFNAWFLRGGIHPPVPAVTSGSFTASLNLVAATDLLTLAPHSAYITVADSLSLHAIEVPWQIPEIAIVFATRATRWNSQPIRALRESL